MRSARNAAAGAASCRSHADRPPPCGRPGLVVRAARPVRSYESALQKPLAGGQPANVVKKLSRGLVDGGEEPHHVADDAGDRAGSLDDRRAMCSWSCEERTRTPRTPSLGGSVGRVSDGRPPYRGRLRGVGGAAPAAVICRTSSPARSVSLRTAR
eukprot:6174442-Prymnesium_polylepis.1